MSHANARLTSGGRFVLVSRIAAGQQVAHVAAEMGVSRTTAWRWWRRFQAERRPGLVDRPSVARTRPDAPRPAWRRGCGSYGCSRGADRSGSGTFWARRRQSGAGRQLVAAAARVRPTDRSADPRRPLVRAPLRALLPALAGARRCQEARPHPRWCRLEGAWSRSPGRQPAIPVLRVRRAVRGTDGHSVLAHEPPDSVARR